MVFSKNVDTSREHEMAADWDVEAMHVLGIKNVHICEVGDVCELHDGRLTVSLECIESVQEELRSVWFGLLTRQFALGWKAVRDDVLMTKQGALTKEFHDCMVNDSPDELTHKMFPKFNDDGSLDLPVWGVGYRMAFIAFCVRSFGLQRAKDALIHPGQVPFEEAGLIWLVDGFHLDSDWAYCLGVDWAHAPEDSDTAVHYDQHVAEISNERLSACRALVPAFNS